VGVFALFLAPLFGVDDVGVVGVDVDAVGVDVVSFVDPCKVEVGDRVGDLFEAEVGVFFICFSGEIDPDRRREEEEEEGEKKGGEKEGGVR